MLLIFQTNQIITTSCIRTLTHEMTISGQLNTFGCKGNIVVKWVSIGIFVFYTVEGLLCSPCLENCLGRMGSISNCYVGWWCCFEVTFKE